MFSLGFALLMFLLYFSLWAVSGFLLISIEKGLRTFARYFGLAVFCTICFEGIVATIINDQGYISMGIFFLWSVALFVKTLSMHKNKKSTYDENPDILDS